MLLEGSPGPKTHGQAVLIHADSFSSEIFRSLDSRRSAAKNVRMNLHAQRKNRQRNDGLVATTCHHVPRERHLSDVEFFVDRPQARFPTFGAARLQLDSFGHDFTIE